MNAAALVTVYAWVGLLVSIALLLAGYGLTALLGKELLRRLRRVYHLSVILYWLGRLERNGTRTFQQPDHDDSPPAKDW